MGVGCAGATTTRSVRVVVVFVVDGGGVVVVVGAVVAGAVVAGAVSPLTSPDGSSAGVDDGLFLSTESGMFGGENAASCVLATCASSTFKRSCTSFLFGAFGKFRRYE